MRKYIGIIAIFVVSVCALGQVKVSPILQPHQTFVDQSGAPCAGCALFSYTAGSTIATPTYKDAGGTVPNTNPIVLSVQGGADIWVNTGVAYKFVLKNTAGTTLWTVDNVAGNSILAIPGGSQSIMQPPGTNFGINTSGGGKFTYNGSEVLNTSTGVQTNPTGNQTVTQPPGTTLAVNSLNGVISANNQTGSDIGAKINAAFSQCATTANGSCVVTLQPNQTYSYSTTIKIPGNQAPPASPAIDVTNPILDCNGASLTYTGSTDGVIVPARNGINLSSGQIRNCNFKATGAAASVIHTQSIIGFSIFNTTIIGSGTTPACILMENINTAAGPLWSEQNTFNKLNIDGCLKGIRLFRNGGTDSYEYNTWTDIHFEMAANTIGLSVEGAVNTLGTIADLRANTYGSAGNQAKVVSATGGGSGSFNMLTIRGESDGTVTDCGLYTDSASFIGATGSILGSNLTTCYGAGAVSSQIQLQGGVQIGLTNLQGNPDNGIELQAGSGSRGDPQNRNCKWDLLNGTPSTVSSVFQAGSAVFGLAHPSGFGSPNCTFEIYRRTTTPAFPEVNIPGSSGNPVQSVLYADSFNGNVGVGPGYGWNGTAFISPTHALEVTAPASGTFFDISSFLTPTMTGGQKTCIVAGKVVAARDEAKFCFNFNASGSVLNYIGIDFVGVDDAFKIYADGSVQVPALAGSGKALACLDSTGKFYRGTATTCP